ncbi:MAG: arginine--tRNA ligase, partial [Promethearchaeota archaeon]
DELDAIYKAGESFGSLDIGHNRNIVIDYSSPNIAKPFGIAHIRSTVIGNSLCKIFEKLGYRSIGINHLGDWGTQFGKLMVAYMKWGDEKKLKEDGIDYLVKIYVEFGEKAKTEPGLVEEARKWFKKLEDGDPKAVSLWELFREMSLEEFNKYYEELGIKFDYIQGESFYNDKLDETIEYIKSKVPTELSEGALIVDLKSKGIKVPLLLRKSDGATTYHTRDLAAALYRLRTFDPEKILYVVGTPQTLHFKQLFAVLEMAGEDPAKFVHVNFGNMTYGGEMMSTRRGNFVPLKDVINKAISMAEEIINEKNPDLENKKEIAKQVGIGAIIFGDLSNDRTRDIDFSWERSINFDGETAPYLQYTHARICSILRKSDIKPDNKIDPYLLKEDIEYELVKILSDFPNVIKSAAESYKPNLIANYLIKLAQAFNKFYNAYKVLVDDLELKKARLLLIDSIRIVIKNGLALLGIEAPEKM